MPIDLARPTYGRQAYQPTYRDTPLFAGHKNLQRSLAAPFYEDYVNKAAGAESFGSVRGGPTLAQAVDMVRPDPRKWSTIAPPRAMAGNILGDLSAPATTSTSKLGSFNLNLIQPFESLHQGVEQGLGIHGGGDTFHDETFFGEAGPSVFGVKPIDVLNWQAELPVKLMERPIALLQVIANRVSGGGPLQTDDDGNAAYPFQKDPAYWQWLHTATDEQLVQQARAVAGSQAAYGRNEQLFNTLMSRFKDDRDIGNGMRSGVDTVDYTALKRTQQNLELYHSWQRMNTQAPSTHWDPNAESWDPTQGKGGYVSGPGADWHPYSGSSLGRDPGFAAWLSSDEGHMFTSAQSMDPNTSKADHFGAILNGLPFGTGLANTFAAPSDEAKAEWANLPQEIRQQYLADAGFTTIATGIVTSLPLFGGIGILGMAAKGSSIPTIARMGQAWALTLKAANVSMAAGLAVTTGAWALESYAPYEDWKEFGREVNLADPVGHSTLGGVMNTAGMFASGTFGAALALRTAARVGGKLDALAGSRIGGLKGQSELSYYEITFGGSPTTESLFRNAGVETTSTELAVKRSLLSFITHGAVRESEVVYRRALDGEPIGIEAVDAMLPADRILWAESQLARTYSAQPALVAQIVERLTRARQRDPLLANEETVQLQTSRAVVRNLVDAASREHMGQYGAEFFGADRMAIRTRISEALTELGYHPNMEGFDREYGTRDNPHTVERWRQLARTVHQLEYSVRDAELHDHLKEAPHEQGATLFSQRTLSVQDIVEALPILRGADGGAARAKAAELVSGKMRVGEAYALGEYRDPNYPLDASLVDPVKLAGHLESILTQNGAPRFRDLPDPAGPTADLPLNAFHRRLLEEGKWQIGFRARERMSPAASYDAMLTQELSAFQMSMLEPGTFTLRDVAPGTVPEGYVELPAGTKIRRTNWYALDPIFTSDGRYLVKDDGTLNLQQAVQVDANRPSNNPANPRPIDRYDTDWETLTADEKTLAREFHRPQSSFKFRSRPDPAYFEATGQVLKGRNAGAEWPVLRLMGPGGDKFLFKARRNPGGELETLSRARLLAGPTATRLQAYLGLHVAEEVPFTWNGVEGTLQPMVDVVEVVDVAKPGQYSQEVINELVNQHIGDWFTSQHDSNADSMLISDDGFVTGVDKGQAYKHAMEDDQAMLREFWDYQSPSAADTHLGEFIKTAVQRGEITLDRQAAEAIIQKIEAMPDDVYLASLEELGAARVADGRFEKTLQEFFDGAIARKRAMRLAVNRAFDDLGYAPIHEPGTLAHWKPGAKGQIDLGTPTQLNERPIPLEDLYAYNDARPVDEPNGDAVTKAGVLIEEPDGRVWIINPKNNWNGYSFTWPKGHVDPGESLQHAAIREGFEETGISVRLKAHLVDAPNENGVVTRYYLAERVAGGPEFIGTPDEIGSLALVKGADVGQYLFRNSKPDPRDNAVAEALLERKLNRNAEVAVEGLDAPGEAEGPITAEPAGEMGYTSHVTLGNGSVWRTAWLDANIREAAQIELGNRGIAGRAYDNLFKGWRAWRITETQKANMHFKLARDYELGPGVSEKVELLHTKLLEIQKKTKGGTIQAIAGVNEHLPFVGRYHDDVAAAAASIFGEGPFLNKKGQEVSIDFNRLIQTSYQQSIRMNFTAGFTSYLKTIPGLGSAVILPATDFVYPLLRFGLSPLFKASEVVESTMLNAMRGVSRTGDPFIDALWWKSGAGSGLGVLAEEAGADMMLQSLSALAPNGSVRGRHGDAGFFYERIDPAQHAANVAGQLSPSSPYRPPPAAGMADSLAGSGGLQLPDPVKFPDTYSEATPRRLLRQLGVDETSGEPLLDLHGGDHTRAQVQRYRDQILGDISLRILENPDNAAAYGSGLAFLASLPPGHLERLAENLPIVHTPTTSRGTDAQIEFARQAILQDYPAFSGRASTGDFSLVMEAASSEEGGVVPQVRQENTGKAGTTISAKEQWVGFADAKYGSAASQYTLGANGEMLVILKPEKLRDSVTVGTDRINLENDVVALQDAMMTPAAVQSITRLELQRMIVDWHVEHPDLDFRSFLNERLAHYFNGTAPFEMAYMNGIRFEDIAAVMLPHTETGGWSDLVQTYGGHDAAKGLDQVAVVPYDNGVYGGYRGAMVDHWLDRAGLAEFGKVFPDIRSADEALMALPPPAVNLQNLQAISWKINDAAGRLGLKVTSTRSHVDEINTQIGELRRALHTAESAIGKELTAPKGYGGGDIKTLKMTREGQVARIQSLEALRSDVREFYAGGEFSGHRDAENASLDPDSSAALVSRAESWLTTEAALKQRMIVAGVKPGSGESVGNIRVEGKNGRTISNAAYGEQAPIEAISTVHGVDGTPRIPASDAPYQLLETQALLDAYQRIVPQGYTVSDPGIIPPGVAGPMLEMIDTPALRAAIRARAEAKLGESLPDPVIRAYLRGSVERIPDQGFRGSVMQPGVDELIVTIQGGNGQPYGNLTIPELGELWQSYGFPADFKARAEGAGFALNDSMAIPGAGGNVLGHGPGPTPEGRFYFYGSNDVPRGTFEQGPVGHEYVDTTATRAFDTSIAYAFEPAGKSYIGLEDGNAYSRATAKVTEMGGGIVDVAYQKRGESLQWAYNIKKGTGAWHDVSITSYNSRSDLLPALRDIFDRTKPQGTTRLRLSSTDHVAAFERLYARGEVPDHIIAIDAAGDVLDAFRVVEDFSSKALVDLLPEPPAADFTEVKGTPESFLARSREMWSGMGARGKAAAEAIWNPVPGKQVKMDRLTFHLARRTFAPLLKAENPRAAGVFAELKVPDHKWADFLLMDRHLLSRWKESGSRADFEALVLHASEHTGKAEYMASRKGLDELYMSPEFETMLDTWGATVKAAQDESYQVHFFSQYRSTFERTINHPVFGIYPASWSFKVAKEWFRFLYQNETLGFKAGMVPAALVKQLTDAQAVAWAQSNPEDLQQFYEDGPLSSSIFIFNLLLPGDWSSIPFPMSRTLRDVARGKANPFDIYTQLTSMGLGRDIRLGAEAGGELIDVATGAAGKGQAFNSAWSVADAPDLPQGEARSPFARAESIRSYFSR